MIALLCCFSGRVGGSGGGGSGGGRGDVCSDNGVGRHFRRGRGDGFRADSGGFDFDGAAWRAGPEKGSNLQVCEI